jgi:NADH-quinone oxidoreductase subunit M
MSIVVTAVYILRAVGQTLMGPLGREGHHALSDAAWYERAAALILIAGILAMGLAPFWLNDLVAPATELIANRIGTLP